MVLARVAALLRLITRSASARRRHLPAGAHRDLRLRVFVGAMRFARNRDRARKELAELTRVDIGDIPATLQLITRGAPGPADKP